MRQQGQQRLPHQTEGETRTWGEVVPCSSPARAEPLAQHGALGPAHPPSLQSPRHQHGSGSLPRADTPPPPPPPPALAPHLTHPGSPFASGLRPNCPICCGSIPSAGATSTTAAEQLQQPRTKPVKPTLHPNPNTSGESDIAFPGCSPGLPKISFFPSAQPSLQAPVKCQALEAQPLKEGMQLCQR